MLSGIVSHEYEEPRLPRRGSHRPVFVSAPPPRPVAPNHVRGLCVLELPPSLVRVSHRMCSQAACRNMAFESRAGFAAAMEAAAAAPLRAAPTRNIAVAAAGHMAAAHCMRSRKYKHFCGPHAALEKTQGKALPSLAQALLATQRYPPALPTRASRKKSWL